MPAIDSLLLKQRYLRIDINSFYFHQKREIKPIGNTHTQIAIIIILRKLIKLSSLSY